MNKVITAIAACAIGVLLTASDFAAVANASTGQTSASKILRSQWQKIAARTDGLVGAAALNLDTGERVQLNGDRWYPMQSVYKLPIAISVLRFVDRGKLDLNQQVAITPKDYVKPPQHSPLRDEYPDGTTMTLKEIVRAMVCESDGSACDVCLRLAGEPKAVGNDLLSMGIKGVQIHDTEKQIGTNEEIQYQNSTTPNSMVGLLQKLDKGEGLSSSSHQLLMKFLVETSTGKNRLKGKLKGLTVAHKTGSSGTVNGVTAATNDVGIITLPDGRRIAIAVFVSKSSADQATREGVIADIAHSAVNYWTH